MLQCSRTPTEMLEGGHRTPSSPRAAMSCRSGSTRWGPGLQPGPQPNRSLELRLL